MCLYVRMYYPGCGCLETVAEYPMPGQARCAQATEHGCLPANRTYQKDQAFPLLGASKNCGQPGCAARPKSEKWADVKKEEEERKANK